MSTGPMNYEERKMSVGGGKTPLQQRFDLAQSSAPQTPGYVYFGTEYGRQGQAIDKFEKVADAKYKFGSFSDALSSAVFPLVVLEEAGLGVAVLQRSRVK